MKTQLLSKATANAIMGTLVSAATIWLGGLDGMVLALCALMLTDLISGVMAAGVDNKIESRLLIRGFLKKFAMLMLVSVSCIMDKVMGLETPYVRTTVIMYLIGNEGISNLENIGRVGVELPAFLLPLLKHLKNGGKEEGTHGNTGH